jgi:hypothetical protein
MPSKRSTRFTVKQAAKRLKKQFASRNFAKTHFTVKRPMAIGIIIVSIVGTAMLIVANSSEQTSAASVVPDHPIVAVAPPEQTPVAKAQKRSAAAAQPASAETARAVAASDLATVEGCLVQEEDQFRLKNTTGEAAPKGRSWKSGFLHKSSKTIDVLDNTHRLNLGRHVGERVAVTGVLDNRELQGTALKRVAESCN